MPDQGVSFNAPDASRYLDGLGAIEPGPLGGQRAQTT